MEPKHHIVTLENLRMHNAHACYPQEKWPIVCMAIQGRERSIFQRKRHKFRARSVQCILAYPNPFGSLAQNLFR